MGLSIPLKRLGAYALDELERAIALLAANPPGALLGCPTARIALVEIELAFATTDGSAASPTTVVVGEAPLPPSEVRKLLEPLDMPVLVALADIAKAQKTSVGRLILRVLFPPDDAKKDP